MKRLIRENLRDFLAVCALIALATGVSYYIFQEQRLRIPVLEEKPYELQAEFETAQAVVPGQGQTVRVAGVRVGDVSKVDLVDGRGIVSFDIDREFTPIYRDATLLMRPTTGLKDMFFDLDPGSAEAGEYEEGDTIPMANTAPDVNLDEILAALDGDTRSYLRMLLVGGGQGLEGRAKDLGQLLGSLGPLNRDFSELNRQVASRRQELAEMIHSFNLLTTRVGKVESELTRVVSSSREALGVIAEQDPSVQRAISLLPSTLEQAETTLTSMARFGEVLGPAFNDLRPFARNLDELNASNTRLAEFATPVLENEIRPFVRQAREVVPDARSAAARLAKAAPGLKTTFGQLNTLFNLASNNPDGAEPTGTPGRDEGYLYWASWLGHNTASVYSTADGNGYFRRIYLSMGCQQAAELVADPVPQVEQLRKLVSGYTDALLAEVCGP